jgi:hypothetical protein
MQGNMRVCKRIACITLLLLLAVIPSVNAQQVPPALDNSVTLSAADYMAMSTEFVRTPFKDPYLTYKVRLPNGWTEVGEEALEAQRLSSRLLGEVSRFAGPAEGAMQSSFKVSALQMDYFVSVENWFQTFLLTNKYTLLGLKVKGTRIDARYQVLRDGREFVVRAVAIANGSRMVLAEYSVPAKRFDKEKDNQTWAAMSFSLLKADTSLPEPIRPREMLDVATFLYPESWTLISPAIRNPEEMATTIVLAGGQDNPVTQTVEIDITKARGRMEIIGKRRAGGHDPIQFASWVADVMKAEGVAWGEKIAVQPKPLTLDKSLISDGVASYYLLDTMGRALQQEVWIVLAHTDRYDYAVLLVTPGRSTDFAAWARNISTFELVARSVRHILPPDAY